MTKTDRDLIKAVSALSNQSFEATKAVLDGLYKQAFISYLEGKEMHIPKIGTFTMKFVEDRVERRGKVTIVDAKLNLLPELSRNIGQEQAGEITDIENQLLKQNIKTFDQVADE